MQKSEVIFSEIEKLAKAIEIKQLEYAKQVESEKLQQEKDRLAKEQRDEILNNFHSALLTLVADRSNGTFFISVPYRQVGVTSYLSKLSIPGVLVVTDNKRGLIEDRIRGCSIDTIIFDSQESKKIWNKDFHKRYEQWSQLCNKGKPIKVILINK